MFDMSCFVGGLFGVFLGKLLIKVAEYCLSKK